MTGIVEFLLDRIDEDQTLAQHSIAMTHAVGTPGEWVEDRWTEDEVPAFGFTCELPFSAAEHMAHWDPIRVLAECAAKRRIIEIHGENVGWTSLIDGEFYPPERRGQCSKCGYAEGWEIRENGPTFPCSTLKALAAIYQEHPAFDPDWSTA